MSDPIVKSFRRYCLLKKQAKEDNLNEDGLAATWQAKQEAEESIALPADYPSRAALIAAGYSTLADLDGADVAELKLRVSITKSQAEAVIAAIPTIV